MIAADCSLIIELRRGIRVDEDVVVEPLRAALAPEAVAGQVQSGGRRSLREKQSKSTNLELSVEYVLCAIKICSAQSQSILSQRSAGVVICGLQLKYLTAAP